MHMKMLVSLVLLAILPCSLSVPYSTCTDGFTLVQNKCLKLFTNPVKHADAERTCMDYGATLVTMKTAIDNQAVYSIAGNTVPIFWVGLYCVGDEASSCLWDDYSGYANEYSNFASGFPLVEVGKCVYYSTQGALAGRWLSGECNHELKPFVCELPVTFQDTCQFNYNGYCYSFSKQPAYFDRAQELCEQQCGNLVSIHSAMENRYISTLLFKNADADILTGAIWLSDDNFQWIDNSAWDYSDFDPTFKKYGNCLAISNGVNQNVPYGNWYSKDCTAPLNYICKRPAGLECSSTPAPIIVTPAPSNPSGCNSSLLLSPGVITSPNYPKNYDNLEYCEYHLTTLGSYVILLKFTHFDTELNDDIVRVYDGETTDSKLIGKFSGDSAHGVVSSGNTMTVTFTTDKYYVFSGFRATFTAYAYGR